MAAMRRGLHRRAKAKCAERMQQALTAKGDAEDTEDESDGSSASRRGGRSQPRIRSSITAFICVPCSLLKVG